MKRRSLAMIAALASACSPHPPAQFGGTSVSSPTDIDKMINGLRAYQQVARTDIGRGAINPGPLTGPEDFLHQFFGGTYNGQLVDAVYFVDVDDDGGDGSWAKGPRMFSRLRKGDQEPDALADEQEAWALVMIAAPKADCFSATVFAETIVPDDTNGEQGIITALLALTKKSRRQRARHLRHRNASFFSRRSRNASRTLRMHLTKTRQARVLARALAAALLRRAMRRR